MTEREQQLQTALCLAHEHLIEALKVCPNECGGKEKLERAFRELDSFVAWFEQTHA